MGVVCCGRIAWGSGRTYSAPIAFTRLTQGFVRLAALLHPGLLPVAPMGLVLADKAGGRVFLAVARIALLPPRSALPGVSSGLLPSCTPGFALSPQWGWR